MNFELIVRSMSKALGAGICVSACATALTGCPATTKPPVVPPADTTTVPLVPLSVHQPADALNPVDHNPQIAISVGGVDLPMLFDTGSTGLRVYMPALPASAYTPFPAETITQRFGTMGSSTTYSYLGYRATADIRVAGIDVGVQSFQLVTSITGNATFSGEMRYKGMGVFGVAPNQPPAQGPALPNLMTLLPGKLNTGFVVSLYNSRLVLGVTPEMRRLFQLYQVPTVPGTPFPYWKTALFPWCYSISVPQMAPITAQCPGNTFTDTGGLNAHLFFTSLPAPSPSPGVTPFPLSTLVTLPAGSTITAVLAQSGSTTTAIAWSPPPAGTCSGYDMVNVFFGGGGAQGAGTSSNGINPFFSNDVMYDFEGSNFGFRAVPSSLLPNGFCSP